MTKLHDILDVAILEKLIEDGYISRKKHNEYPLFILNYTPMAQYDPKLIWGQEMNLSRGLIYHSETSEVIARPFPKFWNLNDERHPETMEANLPSDVPVMLEKLDGSMGVLFAWDGLNHVATRGSFHSEQAQWATAWLRSRFPRLSLPQADTLISEVIYAENKIVVDYDFEGLVILGSVSKETGRERSRSEMKDYCRALDLPLVKEYRKTLAEGLAENDKNREGYVVMYPSTGLKVKVKFEEYCRLHRILTGMSVRSVWELLRDGQGATIHGWLSDERMPEGFRAWVKGVMYSLIEQWEEVISAANKIYAYRPQLSQFMPYKESRKQMAMYFNNDENRKYAGLLFGLLDGKNIDLAVWKMVEPSGNATFKVDGE